MLGTDKNILLDLIRRRFAKCGIRWKYSGRAGELYSTADPETGRKYYLRLIWFLDAKEVPVEFGFADLRVNKLGSVRIAQGCAGMEFVYSLLTIGGVPRANTAALRICDENLQARFQAERSRNMKASSKTEGYKSLMDFLIQLYQATTSRSIIWNLVSTKGKDELHASLDGREYVIELITATIPGSKIKVPHAFARVSLFTTSATFVAGTEGMDIILSILSAVSPAKTKMHLDATACRREIKFLKEVIKTS